MVFNFCILNFILCIYFSLSAANYKFREEYIEVPIDHFSFIDDRTFHLRYLINDSYWQPNQGPIFFYAGNENAIEPFAKNTGYLWESAVRFKALIIFAEHRFYGKSMPFKNNSYSDSKHYSYLTTQQAIADFVDLLYHIRETRSRSTSKRTNNIANPIIAFGGSYGGMLAAWMRMKHPALIQGALASSAPIWYFPKFVSCDAYYEWVTKVYRSTMKHCPRNIRHFWDELHKTAETKKGRKWFSKTWHLCEPLKTSTDARVLRSMLSSMFTAASIVNYPYANDFLKPLPAHPVKAMCEHLKKPNMTGKPLLKAMSKVAKLYFNYKNENQCLKWPQSSYGDEMTRGWNIQTCMDMVMPFCRNGLTDMFVPYNWTVESVTKHCYSRYKLRPDANLVEKLYGGKNLDAASNIIFSNGELDPWSSGGVLRYKTNPSITTVLLRGAAHHLDLRAAHPLDPASVIKARSMYEKKFRKWIDDYYRKRTSNSETEKPFRTSF